MIEELNHSLERWLRDAADLPIGRVDVQFDQPEADWTGRRPVPLVNLFVYELARSKRRSVAGLRLVADGDGMGRMDHVPTIEARYLIGVWGGGSGAEHDVLARIVHVLAQRSSIPDPYLTETLRLAQPRPALSLAPDERASTIQLWQALNVPARAGAQLLVEAPMALPTTVRLAPSPSAVLLDTRGLVEPAAYSRRRRVLGRRADAAGRRVATRRGTALVEDSGRYNVEGEPDDDLAVLPPDGHGDV